jgi:hypothetical protein
MRGPCKSCCHWQEERERKKETTLLYHDIIDIGSAPKVPSKPLTLDLMEALDLV